MRGTEFALQVWSPPPRGRSTNRTVVGGSPAWYLCSPWSHSETACWHSPRPSSSWPCFSSSSVVLERSPDFGLTAGSRRLLAWFTASSKARPDLPPTFDGSVGSTAEWYDRFSWAWPSI